MEMMKMKLQQLCVKSTDTNNAKESASDVTNSPDWKKIELSPYVKPVYTGKPNLVYLENRVRIEGTNSMVTSGSHHDAELHETECTREPNLEYEGNTVRIEGTNSMVTSGSHHDVELHETECIREPNLEYKGNTVRIEGTDSVAISGSHDDAELHNTKCTREPNLEYEGNTVRVLEGTNSVVTSGSHHDAELHDTECIREPNLEYEGNTVRIEGTNSVVTSGSHHDDELHETEFIREPNLEYEESHVRIEGTDSVATSASHHDAELNETESIRNKVTNLSIKSWTTNKRKNFVLEVDRLFNNDRSKCIRELKKVMNKNVFTNSEVIRDLLSENDECKKNVDLIRQIRNAIEHYGNRLEKIAKHPDKIFEEIESNAPMLVPEIMYAIVMFCEDEWNRNYVCGNTSIHEYIDVFFKRDKKTNINVSGNQFRFPDEKCFEGYDVAVQSQAWTSICISIVQKLEIGSNCQLVVLARDTDRAEKFQNMEALGPMGEKCGTCFNYEDVKKLQNKTPQVLIGNAGPVKKVFKQGLIDPGSIKVLVIDEPDVFLSGRLKFVVYEILKLLPKNIQAAEKIWMEKHCYQLCHTER